MAIGVSLGIAAIATFIATRWGDLLPVIIVNGHGSVQGSLGMAIRILLLALSAAALVSIMCLRTRNSEQTWLAIAMLVALMDVWLHWQGGNVYTLGVYTGKAVCPLIALTVLVTKLNQIMRLYSQAAENNKLLRALVDKDGLTGLSNRRRFDELLDMEFRRACSLSIPLGLVLIDVDFFKSYNDSYGHLAGDECLRRISSAISGVLRRAGDEAARYGGEEIAVLLPATTADATLTIAEKICRAVSALGIEHRDGVNGIATISAGVSVLNAFDGSARPSDLVGAADKALYLAKRLGKNRVCSLGLDKVNSPVCDPV